MLPDRQVAGDSAPRYLQGRRAVEGSTNLQVATLAASSNALLTSGGGS